MVERVLAKDGVGVRFPLSAPNSGFDFVGIPARKNGFYKPFLRYFGTVSNCG